MSAFQQRYAEQNNLPIPGSSVFEQRSTQVKKQLEADEPWYQNLTRTLLQVPKGVASVTPYGLATGLTSSIAQGESLAELEELKERLPELKAKFPQFDWPEEIDEQAYLSALQDASETFPTVHNIANKIEEKTGIPLEAKTRLQKGVEFASGATKLAPQGSTLRPLNVSLPRPVVGAGLEGARELLIEGGVPEPLADIASFALLKQLPEGSPSLNITAKQKPSGLKERRFEQIEKPTEVSEKRMEKINETVAKDFKEQSQKIIEESPVGETARNLANDPLFKQESRELLDLSQEIADSIMELIPSEVIKKEIADVGAKAQKGFIPSEYDKTYNKILQETLKTFKGKVTPGKLVEQYRKNNSDLGEYFEPGASKAFNRAKRDSLLDQNRAITSVMEKMFPESELVPIFKEGNSRWTNIMDVETLDEFVNSIFEGKINHKKANQLFEDRNLQRIAKRSLGEKGYKQFEQLTKDLLTSEVPYNMLKVAKQKGFENLYSTAGHYILHPKIGALKLGYDFSKNALRNTFNALLDKPQLTLEWKEAVESLKKGNFKKAEQQFESLDRKVPRVPSHKETTEAFKQYKDRLSEKL